MEKNYQNKYTNNKEKRKRNHILVEKFNKVFSVKRNDMEKGENEPKIIKMQLIRIEMNNSYLKRCHNNS